MKLSPPSIALSLSVLASLTSAPAALVISDGDIAADHYVYDLTFPEMSTSTIFNNDVFSQTRVSVFQAGDGVNFVTPDPTDNTGFTTASFVFKFDFTTTNYVPVSLSLTENLFAFVHPEVSETIVTSYSLDGTNYTTIHSVSSVGQTNPQSAGGTPVIIDLSSQPGVVYYQVEFIANTSTFGYGYLGAQWNRLDVTSTAPFEADFTVAAVPEPGSIALLGLATLICGSPFLRRKNRTRR